MRLIPVSYTHLDVYKRQGLRIWKKEKKKAKKENKKRIEIKILKLKGKE